MLGPVGLGYYGYASNLYSILLLISSYSIPMAVSKIVSERLALRQYKNAEKVFRGALIYAAIVGGAHCACRLFRGTVPAAGKSAERGSRPAGAGPHHLSVSHSGSIPGYFQAHQNMTPTSVSQILEQIMNAIVSIAAAVLLINSFAPPGEEAVYGAVGGTLGTGAGVVTGLAFMLLVYFMNRNVLRRRMGRDRNREAESYGSYSGLSFSW